MADRPYRIPVLCGTVRIGARSATVARWVTARLAGHRDVLTQLVELGSLGLATDDEGTDSKHPGFWDLIDRSDGLLIVAPEYNHGYPASLKHALDSNYTEYMHKPVGLVGVSTGPLGGARMIENLLPVLRGIGLVLIQRDATVGNVAKVFREDGSLIDEGIERRIDGLLTELRWMAATMRHGREAVQTRPEDPPVKAKCRECRAPLNHHATIIDEEAGRVNTSILACPACGAGMAEPNP